MMEILGNRHIIPAPDSMKCDVCGDNDNDIIPEDNDELICTTCYVNRYGWESLKENFPTIITSGGYLRK